MGLGFIAGLALYIGGFAFFTYACILADPSTSPAAHLLTQRIPKLLSDRVGRIVGPKTMNTLTKLTEYGFVVVYLLVVLGAWSVMFTFGYELVTESEYVSNYHKYVGYLVFAACMGSWRYACCTPPGTITARNLARFDNYPYDDLLFSNRLCPTAGIRKLARSKFDRATGVHVPRFDHYCGWVNNAVGEENYRHFLIFLVVHVLMCWYGAIMMGICLYGEVVDNDLFNATFFIMSTGAEVKASKIVVLQYLMARHFALSGVFILMAVMGLVLTAFVSFHVYITARGMTTNEFFKWRDVSKWWKNAKKRHEKAVKEGKIAANGNGASSKIVVLDENDVGCAGPTSSTPADSRSSEKQREEKEEEEKITDPGPFPKNIYDRGLRENFGEVFYPRSQRKDAVERWIEARRMGEDGGKGAVPASAGGVQVEVSNAERRKTKAV